MAAKKSKIAEAIADSISDKAKAEKAAGTKTSLDKIFKRMSVGSRSEVMDYIPSGLEVLDKWILGCGGWPEKRISELYSDPSGGKTSLGFAALAGAQKKGGLAILVESEDALQIARATVFGVDLDEVYLSECSSIEEVLTAMNAGLAAIPKGSGPNMMVWDSLAMSMLKLTGEKGLEHKSMGKKANIMSDQFPAIVHKCVDKRVHLMTINQTRVKLGVMFGDPTTTPGGNTHKFAATHRIKMWPGSRVKAGEAPIGFDTTVVCDKSKLNVPHHKAKLRLLYESGWDDRWTTINFAKDRDLIQAEAKPTDDNWHAARAALGFIPMDEKAKDTLAVLAEGVEKPKKGKKGKVVVLEEEDDDVSSGAGEALFGFSVESD